LHSAGGTQPTVTDAGGGIWNANDGVMTVVNSEVSGNLADGNGEGGGFWNQGSLTILDSLVTENKTENGVGAGIFNGGTLTVRRSTISGNGLTGTPDNGGGIYQTGPELLISQSTISGNQSTQWGVG
jgi:hypothetical protein